VALTKSDNFCAYFLFFFRRRYVLYIITFTGQVLFCFIDLPPDCMIPEIAHCMSSGGDVSLDLMVLIMMLVKEEKAAMMTVQKI